MGFGPYFLGLEICYVRFDNFWRNVTSFWLAAMGYKAMLFFVSIILSTDFRLVAVDVARQAKAPTVSCCYDDCW